MKHIGFFDLDYTLVNMNSFYEFISYYLLRKRCISWKIFLLIAYKVVDGLGLPLFSKPKRNRYALLLRGEDCNALAEMGQRFARTRMFSALNVSIRGEVDRLRQAGYRCIVVSSSIDFIVSPFARILGCEAVSSQLATDVNGKCAGSYAADVYGQKHTVVAAMLNELDAESVGACYAYSDNKEDEELLRSVGNGYAVVTSGIRKRYWQARGIRAIEIIPSPRMNLRWLLMPLMYYFRFRTDVTKAALYQVGAPLLVMIATGGQVSPLGVGALLLAICAYIALYEIGYFTNDVYATRHEENPSLRIDVVKGEAILTSFIAIRTVGVLLASLVLYYLVGPRAIVFSVLNFFTLLVFILHNKLEQRKRYYTYAFLKLSHIIVPVSIIDCDMLAVVLIAAFIYLPIPLMRYVAKLYSVNMVMFVSAYLSGVAIICSIVLWKFLNGAADLRLWGIFTGYLLLANFIAFGDRIQLVIHKLRRVESAR